MSKIKLDARLSAVASLVRRGSRVADIGTDHGYLLAWLIENGITPSGIAADINKGPLENARKTVVDAGIADMVELVLSDGLQNVPENSCDDIVLAGMGGNLITDILSECPWIYNKKLHIVAQPMSHAEVLREFYVENGFEILEEKTATDGKRLYCVISAVFTGIKNEKDISYIYLGKLTDNNDKTSKKYIDKTLSALEKKYSALMMAGKDDENNLSEIISSIKNRITEANMIKVKDISDYIDEFAPYSTQCEWDNCGVLVGDRNKEVKRIGFVLDLTKESLTDALKNQVDMIVTHHPVIFKAQKNFLKGNIAFEAASKGLSVLSAHTCFDCACGGVNDTLCEILEIQNPIGVPSELSSVPMARIGVVDEISSADFAAFVSEKLSTCCRVVDCGNIIRKVAVCGGAGADFIKEAVNMGADAYVTGDMDHHEFLLAAEMGITTIAAGHFETENPSVSALKDLICDKFTDIEGVVLRQTNPVKYIG